MVITNCLTGKAEDFEEKFSSRCIQNKSSETIGKMYRNSPTQASKVSSFSFPDTC